MKYDIDGHLWWAPVKKPGGGWIAFKDGSATPKAPSSASTLGASNQTQTAPANPITLNDPSKGVQGGFTGGSTTAPTMTPGFQLETPGFGYGPSHPIGPGSPPATGIGAATAPTPPLGMGSAVPSYASGSMGPMQNQLAPAPQPNYGGYPMGAPQAPMGNPALGPDRMPATVGAQPGQMQSMVNVLRGNLPPSMAGAAPGLARSLPNAQPQYPRAPQPSPAYQPGRGNPMRGGMR